jgi:hypothetical protein
MTEKTNPLEDLALSAFCERIESDNTNWCITHRKLKPLILVIWTFFHRIILNCMPPNLRSRAIKMTDNTSDDKTV